MMKSSIIALAVCTSLQGEILDNCFNNFWISTDLLVLVPHEDAIVLTNHKTNLFEFNDITLQPRLHTPFRWDVGSRIGFGYLCDDRCWDMSINWLRFLSSTQKKSDTRMNIMEGMFPAWSLADDIIPFDWVEFSKLHWSLAVNLLDLDFGYTFNWNCLFLRPYLGIRSAWIDQEFQIKYGGGIFANGPDLAAMSNNAGYDRMHMDNDYWGLGPQIGLEPKLNLGCGFALYGNVCGTFELGYFYLVQNERYLANTRFHKKSTPFKCRWILDAGAGFQWETYLCGGCYGLSFKLGWEYHLFFHHFELQRDRFGIVPNHRNLSLNGGAFSGRFSF